MKRYLVPAHFIICCHLLARFTNCTSTQEGVLRNAFCIQYSSNYDGNILMLPSLPPSHGRMETRPLKRFTIILEGPGMNLIFSDKRSDICLEAQKYFASEGYTSWYFPSSLSNESEKQEKGGSVLFRAEMLLSISSYSLINREEVSERLHFCFVFQRTQIVYQWALLPFLISLSMGPKLNKLCMSQSVSIRQVKYTISLLHSCHFTKLRVQSFSIYSPLNPSQNSSHTPLTTCFLIHFSLQCY